MESGTRKRRNWVLDILGGLNLKKKKIACFFQIFQSGARLARMEKKSSKMTKKSGKKSPPTISVQTISRIQFRVLTYSGSWWYNTYRHPLRLLLAYWDSASPVFAQVLATSNIFMWSLESTCEKWILFIEARFRHLLNDYSGRNSREGIFFCCGKNPAGIFWCGKFGSFYIVVVSWNGFSLGHS